MEEVKIRNRAKRALENYFETRTSPRLILSLVIFLTGGVGFGISYALLQLGLVEMWMRYPSAVVGAYLIFIGLIRVWVALERRRFDPDLTHQPVYDYQSKNIQASDGPSWLDFIPTPDFDFDFDGCLLVGAILGLIALLITCIAAAPVFIAEVFIDIALTGLLYRRLKNASKEHWLGACIRKTWLVVLSTAILLGITGYALDRMAPGSDSMGKALKEILPL